MNCASFYHVYASGVWRTPVAEHLAALEDGKFDGPCYFGIVGGNRERAEAKDEILAIRPSAKIVAEQDRGWEQTTLYAVQRYATKHNGAVLYAHTKGAARPSAFQDAWRREMTHRLVLNWSEHIQALGDHDAVGLHWLTAEEFPNVTVDTPFPMF